MITTSSEYEKTTDLELFEPCMTNQRRNEILHARVVERLKEVRKQKGYTQNDVRFDMNEINIGRIESGKHSITLTTLADLCDHYGITLEEFFRGIETH